MAAIRKIRDKSAILVLDTTYCDPKYDFPPQDDVVRFVREAARTEAAGGDALCLFGTYTIGKEKLFFAAAKALGRKVFVDTAKRRVLSCLDLAEEEVALLTTDRGETNLHVVGCLGGD